MRIFGFIACLVFFFGALNVSAEEQKGKASFDYSNPEFRATVDMLSMDGHGNDDLASCSVKQTYYEDVAEMFMKGMKKQEILDYYERELGVHALQAPPVKGFNLSLWITPFVLLFMVAMLIYFLIKRWKKNNEIIIMDEGLPSLNVEHDIYTSIIEEERKKFL
jgi:cytochrome c-type biogenesis protein CcmH